MTKETDGLKRRWRHSPTWVAALALTLGACGLGPEERPDEQPELGSRKDDLWAVGDRIWLWPNINVCWENPGANATERGWVREAVERTWESVSRVDFTGWGTCANGDKGIRIQIADDRVHTKGVGFTLNGLANGMVLNFTFSKWGKTCQSTPADPGVRERCIRVDAVHEFGHGLGFAHEHDRADKPSTCTSSTPTASQGTHPLDGYDANSIMNYCNPNYANRAWPIALSGSDVRGVQAVYGGKPGMVVGWWGKCLDVAGGGSANGTRVQLWDCLGGANQLWTWHVSPFTSWFTSQQTGKLLDDPGASNANGTQLQIWQRSNYLNAQSWHMKDFMLRGHAGKCLDVANGINANGNSVWLWDCHGGWPQRWFLDPYGRISNQGGKCLEVAGGQSGNGARVQIWDCNGADNQKWSLGSRGEVRSYVGSRCLDVSGGNPNNMAAINLWDCHGGMSQRWSLRGPINHLNNKCVDVRGGGTSNGTAAQVWECLGNGLQEWDYHF